jgi:phenylalanyl-tRNA synthetase alpha chain
MSLQAQLESLKKETIEKISAANDLTQLNQIRVETLGKKGPITEVLRGMKDLTPEERPIVGSFANEIRDLLSQEIDRKKQLLEEAALNEALEKETIDVTLPGTRSTSQALVTS